jgi:hypothetical protein
MYNPIRLICISHESLDLLQDVCTDSTGYKTLSKQADFLTCSRSDIPRHWLVKVWAWSEYIWGNRQRHRSAKFLVLIFFWSSGQFFPLLFIGLPFFRVKNSRKRTCGLASVSVLCPRQSKIKLAGMRVHCGFPLLHAASRCLKSYGIQVFGDNKGRVCCWLLLSTTDYRYVIV